MPAQTYRMLLKDGKGTPYPWTEHLAARKDMKEVYMTASEISGIVKSEPVTEIISDTEEVVPVVEEFAPKKVVKKKYTEYTGDGTQVNVADL